ncbi:Rha family transcriptional regulator [Limnohabitans sp. T6-5]|uniref:Rha family transcriptional regulator n=1 Tax=Limnohabitans sp. T6-5 TaxID=1100724 RepID=UPI000D38B22C|nr:Rha family transcriptional regulator [Limnohabitans sp. T6-5]
MLDLSEFVTLNNETLVTDSRRVAKHFKRAHKNVLRAFDAMECTTEFNRLNFEPRDFTDSRGKQQREIWMTKDGFIFLVMGFTGSEAAKIKEAYITAFNTMADQLTRIQNTLWRQMLDLERRDANSQSWASFGSKCMLERKRDKPLLENERSLLQDRIQPSLLN